MAASSTGGRCLKSHGFCLETTKKTCETKTWIFQVLEPCNLGRGAQHHLSRHESCNLDWKNNRVRSAHNQVVRTPLKLTNSDTTLMRTPEGITREYTGKKFQDVWEWAKKTPDLVYQPTTGTYPNLWVGPAEKVGKIHATSWLLGRTCKAKTWWGQVLDTSDVITKLGNLRFRQYQNCKGFLRFKQGSHGCMICRRQGPQKLWILLGNHQKDMWDQNLDFPSFGTL